MKFIVIAAILAIAIAVFIGVRSCDTGPDLTDVAPVTDEVPITESVVPDPVVQFVDVGGHRLYVRTYGTGSPTVVIEPGIGDAGTTWADVIAALRDDMKVVLYSRAGYGESDPGPMPRAAQRIAGELAAMLEGAEGVEPPYIVVGHSIGAINALVFTSEHRNLVEGLVLLDPPPVDFIRGRRFPDLRAQVDSMTAGFRVDAGRARAAGDERRAVFYETMASEHEEMFRSGGTWVESVSPLGTMPLVVVASGVPDPQFEPQAEEFQRFWRQSSEELTALSLRGEFMYDANATHDLPGEATDTVVLAIRRVIALMAEPLDPIPYYEDEK